MAVLVRAKLEIPARKVIGLSPAALGDELTHPLDELVKYTDGGQDGAGGAGAVDQHVDRPQQGFGPCRHSVEIAPIGDIRRDDRQWRAVHRLIFGRPMRVTRPGGAR